MRNENIEWLTIRKADFDEVAARLTEAEHLLREARSPLDQHFTRACRDVIARIDAFLRTPDRETAP
jgi:hypothetical protein